MASATCRKSKCKSYSTCLRMFFCTKWHGDVVLETIYVCVFAFKCVLCDRNSCCCWVFRLPCCCEQSWLDLQPFEADHTDADADVGVYMSQIRIRDAESEESREGEADCKRSFQQSGLTLSVNGKHASSRHFCKRVIYVCLPLLLSAMHLCCW